MTREEREDAIKFFKEVAEREVNNAKYSKLAIEALEQESVLEKIRAEIEQLPTSRCTETCRININADDFKENVLEIFNKYKAESEEI